MIRNSALLNFLLNQTLMVVFVTKIGAHGIATKRHLWTVYVKGEFVTGGKK